MGWLQSLCHLILVLHLSPLKSMQSATGTYWFEKDVGSWTHAWQVPIPLAVRFSSKKIFHRDLFEKLTTICSSTTYSATNWGQNYGLHNSLLHKSLNALRNIILSRKRPKAVLRSLTFCVFFTLGWIKIFNTWYRSQGWGSKSSIFTSPMWYSMHINCTLHVHWVLTEMMWAAVQGFRLFSWPNLWLQDETCRFNLCIGICKSLVARNIRYFQKQRSQLWHFHLMQNISINLLPIAEHIRVPPVIKKFANTKFSNQKHLFDSLLFCKNYFHKIWQNCDKGFRNPTFYMMTENIISVQSSTQTLMWHRGHCKTFAHGSAMSHTWQLFRGAPETFLCMATSKMAKEKKLCKVYTCQPFRQVYANTA